MFLLLFSSEAEPALPPSYLPKLAVGFLEKIYLPVALPEAFDRSVSLKEKKETEFLLIVRKS